MPPSEGTGRRPFIQVWASIIFLSHTQRSNFIIMIATRSGGAGRVQSSVQEPCQGSLSQQNIHWLHVCTWRGNNPTELMLSFVKISEATNHYKSSSQLPTAIPLHMCNSSPEFLPYFAILRTHCLIPTVSLRRRRNNNNYHVLSIYCVPNIHYLILPINICSRNYHFHFYMRKQKIRGVK